MSHFDCIFVTVYVSGYFYRNTKISISQELVLVRKFLILLSERLKRKLETSSHAYATRQKSHKEKEEKMTSNFVTLLTSVTNFQTCVTICFFLSVVSHTQT